MTPSGYCSDTRNGVDLVHELNLRIELFFIILYNAERIHLEKWNSQIDDGICGKDPGTGADSVA
jgi:hypothetical protein